MTMKKKLLSELRILATFVIAGQILFAIVSPGFTAARYEGRIYATTGVKHKQEDLHKLNESAHYFGQTIIGWLKFPNFMNHLDAVADLPDGTSLSAHIQERQNIIFTLSSPKPVELDTLYTVKNFIQSKIDEYNSVSQTEFVLTNLDYEQVEIKKSYAFGAIITLLLTVVLGLGALFIRREIL